VSTLAGLVIPGAAPFQRNRGDRDLWAEGRLGRVHAGKTFTVAVSETTLAIELDGAETRVVRRATATPVRNIKADRPWTIPTVS
jgi:hypothetical protein